MTARVLVVDDIVKNVKLLEAKLTNEYYDVVTALSGEEALEIIKNDPPDIVLLDVMMPKMDGFEVCRRIRANEKSAHIPVIMVTALDQTKDRVTGLEAGADDFLTKPIQDLPLLARVRSLVRTKFLMDELRLRETTGKNFEINMDINLARDISLADARVLVIEDHVRVTERICLYIKELALADVNNGKMDEISPQDLGNYDLFILSLDLDEIDGLRLCSQLRSSKHTRRIPILVLVEEGQTDLLAKSMDLGATDSITRPIDRNELLARAKTQIRQKRYADCLRSNIIEMTIKDAVTGLYNQHFLEKHIDNLMLRKSDNRRQIALLMLDIDKFKQVNDTHGHAAGDAVLREFSRRICDNIRNIDLAARLGGDEFVVVMPGSNYEYAKNIAERLRKSIADEPFKITATDQPVTVTTSIGVALSGDENSSRTDLLAATDIALYQAKKNGRNQVCCEEQHPTK